mgnify:CR=1 FL=1
MPRQHVENTKEFWSENEAKRTNKHANKRIFYWPPFWNKVYYVFFANYSNELNSSDSGLLNLFALAYCCYFSRLWSNIEKLKLGVSNNVQKSTSRKATRISFFHWVLSLAFVLVLALWLQLWENVSQTPINFRESLKARRFQKRRGFTPVQDEVFRYFIKLYSLDVVVASEKLWTISSNHWKMLQRTRSHNSLSLQCLNTFEQ